MNIVDAIIIIVLILGIMTGFRRGLIREVVYLVGMVITLVLSFTLRVPIATFLYKTLPFFNFDGIFHGISIINILLYETIAFLVVFSVIYLILRIILKITGLIEKILKATIILGFFSKLLGGLVGFIESYIIVFIVLFILSQPFINIQDMDKSKISNYILDNTPVMSNYTKEIRTVVNEVYTLSKTYKKDSKTFNNKSIELFIKYDIISEENVKLLKEKGKLK